MNTTYRRVQPDDYWLEFFHDFRGKSPAEFWLTPNTDRQYQAAGSHELFFPDKLMEMIKRISKGNDINEFGLLLSGLFILFYRFKASKLYISSPSLIQKSNVGESARLLFFKINFEKEDSLMKVFSALKDQLKLGVANQSYDPVKLEQKLIENKICDFSELFQIGFSYDLLADIKSFETHKFQLWFNIIHDQNSLKLKINYSSLDYPGRYIKMLASRYFDTLYKSLSSPIHNLTRAPSDLKTSGLV